VEPGTSPSLVRYALFYTGTPKIMKVFFTSVAVYITFFCSAQQTSSDSLSLNERVNKEIKERLKLLPPEMRFEYFVDGEKVQTGFQTIIKINDLAIATLDRGDFMIDTNTYKKTDSIQFVFHLGKFVLASRKSTVKRYWRGGYCIFGVITRYESEADAFKRPDYSIKQEDPSLQFQALTLGSENDKNLTPGSWMFAYSFVAANINGILLESFCFEKCQ
jgi:hypothetical protein